MSLTVELGLSKAFTLDDPVAGVIGSTEFTIGGVSFEDITDRVRSVSIGRGKNRDLDRFNAGVLSVELNNEDRAFDPLYTSSPFAGNIVPRRDIRVLSPGSAVQYVGKITDWNFSFEPNGRQLASLQAADGLTFLAQQDLTSGTATAQLTGARVNAVLSQASVDWPVADRDIDTGNSQLGTDVFDGNVLSYLQKVEQSEGGLLFIDKQGRVAFRDRLTTPTVDNVTVFADDGSGIPFAPAALDYGTEQLHNQVTVTSPSSTAVANDALSQTRYGIAAISVDTLIDDAETVEGLAELLLSRFKEPQLRFQQIRVDVDKISSAQRTTVFGLEIGDVLQVKITPGNPPVGSQIERYGQIIQIGHEVTPDEHFITFGLGSLQTSLFVIGDSEFGTIGVDAPGVLGF
jgi:translation elongation factor EF-1beta